MTRILPILSPSWQACRRLYDLQAVDGIRLQTRKRAWCRLSYEYRRFESPQVDERAGIELARERCTRLGIPERAQRKGEDRQCTDGTESDCSKWRVITRVPLPARARALVCRG